MKRFKSNHKNTRKTKKERFWAGSGKFFLVLIFLYAIIFGINKIVNIGKEELDNFTAENVEVTGNEILPREKVIEMCGFSKSAKKLENINIDKIAASLMKSEFIKGVSVTKHLPRTLNITIEERKPIAFIYGRGLNLIDDEGFLIPLPKIKKSWDLPLISGINERLGQLGKKTKSKQALFSIKLVEHLWENDILLSGLISEINMSNKKYLELILVRGGTKIRINRNNFKKELYILQNYVANYLDWNDLAIIDYIDLRFNNQLIVKNKT